MRAAVERYVKKKYMAAGGGEIDDEDAEISDENGNQSDDSDGADEPSAPPPQAAPSASPAEDAEDSPAGDEEVSGPAAGASPAAAPAPGAGPDQGELEAYLADKYGKAADSSGVRAAQEHKQKGDRILAIGEALEGIARSKSQSVGGQGVNHQSYNDASARLGEGVTQAEHERQTKIQGFLQQEAIKQMVVKRQLEAGSFAARQQAAQIAKNHVTPGSAESVEAVAQWNKLYPEHALDPKTASAGTVEKLGKMVVAKDNSSIKRFAAETRAQTAKATAETAAGVRADKEEAKAKGEGEKAYTRASTLAEGGRGAPISVVQALKDRTSVQKINKAFEKYPDLDKMPAAQVHNVIDEIQKIATGGAGTESGREGQNPNTLSQRFAHFQSVIGNEPTGAQVGKFLQENKDLVDGYGEQAASILADHRKSVYNGARGSFTPEQDKRWRETHAQDFKGENEEASLAALPKAGAAPASPAVPDMPPEQLQKAIAEERARRAAQKGGMAVGSK